jgi:hypothetical protein
VGGAFRAGRDGGVSIRLDPGEVSILRSLVAQVLELVEPGSTGEDPLERALGIGAAEVRPPTDPVLARLFPSAYAEDEDAATEFRRYTEASLRDGKRADAEIVLRTARPGLIELDADQAKAWLRSLNDVRLALGTRLDVSEEVHVEIDRMSQDDERYPAYVTYDWLTYLQDSLVQALW